MARINIEDSLFKDDRFINLVILMGSKQLALGHIVSAWMLAQKYWVPNKQKIPEDKWKESGNSELIIKAGLANRTPGGIYVCGTQENFNWLLEARINGKKGGFKKAVRKNSNATHPMKSLKNPASQAKPIVGSSSSSSSSSFLFTPSSNLNLEGTLAGVPPNDESLILEERNKNGEAPGITNQTWQVYSEAFFSRYKTKPLRNAMVNGQIKNLIGRVGKDIAPPLAKFYLTQNDAWYLKNTHSMGDLLRDAEKLYAQWKLNPTGEKKSEWVKKMERLQKEKENENGTQSI